MVIKTINVLDETKSMHACMRLHKLPLGTICSARGRVIKRGGGGDLSTQITPQILQYRRSKHVVGKLSEEFFTLLKIQDSKLSILFRPGPPA